MKALLSPLPPFQALGLYWELVFSLSPSISRWSLSTLDLCLGLGLALSIVTCVVLIGPLHGVGFMVSVMLLSEKNLPVL